MWPSSSGLLSKFTIKLLVLRIRALNYTGLHRLWKILRHSDKIHLSLLQESDEYRSVARPRSTLLHCLMSSERLINRGPPRVVPLCNTSRSPMDSFDLNSVVPSFVATSTFWFVSLRRLVRMFRRQNGVAFSTMIGWGNLSFFLLPLVLLENDRFAIFCPHVARYTFFSLLLRRHRFPTLVPIDF